MSTVYFALSAMMMDASPLMMAALGGIVSQYAGVINIGLEGALIMGAFTAASVAHFTGSPWLAFFVAGFVGMLFMSLLSGAVVWFRADQIISGIALNFMAMSVAPFVSVLIFGGVGTPGLLLESKLPKIIPEDTSFEGFIDIIGNQRFSFIILLLSIALVWIFLFYTPWGLRLRACGENPQAAHSLGIHVGRWQFVAVLASGLLAAGGGAFYSLDIVGSYRPGVINGQGFIAIAAFLFGRYHPLWTYGVCLFFGLMRSLEVSLGNDPYLAQIFPSSLLALIPYAMTLVALLWFSHRQLREPKALGKPFISSL